MSYSELSDLELLVRIVGERDAKRLFTGKLATLFQEPPKPGRAHTRLRAARELVKRLIAEDLQQGWLLTDPSAVTNYLRVLLAGKEHEIFVCLFLDNRHRLIASEEMFRGTIDGAEVYPREVLKRALHFNAAAIICAHNHPSGSAEPSAADRAVTLRLRDALATVEIRVLDHFVVGGTSTTSLAARGWI
jgi:DNA repair protein RadC